MTFNGKKWKFAFTVVSLQIFRFILQKCCLSSPLRFIWILSKSLNLIGCHGNIKCKFWKNIQKINSSETAWGIKLKLFRIVSNNSLYKNIEIYCFLTADILIKVLQKCSWRSPLQTIWILSKSLILIGCHGNLNVTFSKKKSKLFVSEVIRGWSWNFA